MKYLALVILFPVVCFAQTQETYKERAGKNLPFLVKGSGISNQVVVDNNGIHLYENPLRRDKKEFFLSWAECPLFMDKLENLDYHSIQAFYKQKGIQRMHIAKSSDVDVLFYKYSYKFIPYKAYRTELEGLYVAIDPGHYAGSWEEAVAEERYVKVRGSEFGQKGDIKFYESDLTYATAYILKKKLEAMGAVVFLSRESGKSAVGLSFEDWYERKFHLDLDSCLKTGDISRADYIFLKHRATKKEVHDRFFRFLDFRARSRVINEFMPHVTLILHFNAEESNKRDSEGYLSPVEDNYNMAFIPGAFVDGELQKTDQKIDFIRLLLSSDYDNSARLANHILTAHKNILGVKSLPRENSLSYLEKVCQPTDYEGVYARNLYLSRSIRGPVVYVESLIQDSREEIINLSKRDYKIDGLVTTSRAAQVADAFITGLQAFLEENKIIEERLFSTATEKETK